LPTKKNPLTNNGKVDNINDFDIQKLMVLACLATGLTHTIILKYFTIIGCQFVSNSSFYEIQQKIIPVVTQKIETKMNDNAREMIEKHLQQYPECDSVIKISFDFTWGTRGYKSQNGAGRLLMKDPSTGKNVCIMSKTMEKSRMRVIDENNTIQIVQGNHIGSSKSMESICLKNMLDEFVILLASSKQKLNHENTVKLSICIDGDVSSFKQLKEHPIVETIVRDRSHILKNVFRHIKRSMGSGKEAKIYINRIRRHLAWVLDKGFELNWTMEHARTKFLNFVHHDLGNHTFCFDPSSCCNLDDISEINDTEEYEDEDEEIEPIFEEPPIEPEPEILPFETVFADESSNRLMKVLQIIWPNNENVTFISNQRTSEVENVNSVCNHFHSKSTDFLTSWHIRDQIGVYYFNFQFESMCMMIRNIINVFSVSDFDRRNFDSISKNYEKNKKLTQKKLIDHTQKRIQQAKNEKKLQAQDIKDDIPLHTPSGDDSIVLDILPKKVHKKTKNQNEMNECGINGDLSLEMCSICNNYFKKTNISKHKTETGCKKNKRTKLI
jgi:hypothetical protein